MELIQVSEENAEMKRKMTDIIFILENKILSIRNSLQTQLLP
jgi:hypothetical protein